MRKKLRNLLPSVMREQAGQALILVLVFLLLGSLTIAPVLMQMSTTLKSNIKYENKAGVLYTADAGIENGLWRIKYDVLGGSYDPYDYDTVWTFQTDPLNNRSAEVTVQNVWLPSNISLDDPWLNLSPAEAREMLESEKLVITGTSGAIVGRPYRIKVEFTPAAGDNLTIKSLGIWLPQGFTYDPGTCDLETLGPEPDSIDDDIVPGGRAVVWNYDDDSEYPLFTSFPNFTSENGTQTSIIEFTYLPPPDNPGKLPVGTAWITCEMHDGSGNPVANPSAINNVPLSWDIDTRFYRITSSAEDVNIDAYSSKSQLRNLGGAIAGDYVAIGNSLMIDPDYWGARQTWLPESSTDVEDVSPIPEDADVIAAYLYWSGFQYGQNVIPDDPCSNFDNWEREIITQTRVPTGDGGTSGTWITAPRWDDVDETVANDYDSMTGTSPGYQLFTFSPFTVPAGSPIADLTIYFRASDNTSGGNNIRSYIRVDGDDYGGTSYDPGAGFTTYSYSYVDNPEDNDNPWLVEDINGTGSNPLERFGVYSSDLSPDIDVSMVYTEVNISPWTVSSGRFQGRGSTTATTQERTLTLKDCLDFSDMVTYPSGTLGFFWTQSESGTLEPEDTLYCALSSDNGTTWSENIKIFSDDSPAGTGYCAIPDDYRTDKVKIRFYFNFDNLAEYVRLDNIGVYYMPPDTAVDFKIDGTQVYLDANGDPQEGAQPLFASYSAMLGATAGVSSGRGYFFACYRDVSKLVKKYPEAPGEEHHTGNAAYTVGQVSAQISEQVSYAGWSLIIIYSSPGTAGHYLYLRDIRDVFAFQPGYILLDFDGDGEPGGMITNFVIPEPIKNKSGQIIEAVAANVTCFVGEGDIGIVGDYLQITGQSGNSDNLSNAVSPENNVWNSESPGMTLPGIDVDTFSILWTDDIIKPTDTKLWLYMGSANDAWNLIYVIISVRSETVTSGAEHYLITSD